MRGLATFLFVTAACIAAPAAAQDAIGDPWEGANRDLYAVHDSIDRAVLEPVAKGYRAVTNRPIRTGVSNFLRNLRSPVVFANDVLQGEPRRAGATVARFGVNTTVGLLGVLDPAESLGLERHDEDFGQTLAVWGVPSGPYVFVPLLGPTTVRDGLGGIVDIAFQPLTWAEFEGDDAVRATRIGLTAVSVREELIEPIEDTRASSLDPYITYKVTYGALRASAIRNGAPAPDEQPTGAAAGFEDEDFSWTQDPDAPSANTEPQEPPAGPAVEPQDVPEGDRQ